MFLRIEVRSSTDVRFFIDTNTANGITETECQTGISTTPTAAMSIFLKTSAGAEAAITNTLDIDYFQSWQDDNVPVEGLEGENTSEVAIATSNVNQTPANRLNFMPTDEGTMNLIDSYGKTLLTIDKDGNTTFNGVITAKGLAIANTPTATDSAYFDNAAFVTEGNASSSATLAGKLIAQQIEGTEVLTPLVIADSVRVDKIESNTSGKIVTQLLEGHVLGIHNQDDQEVVQIDSEGNGYFKGTLTAQKIRANQIEGLEIYTNRVDTLDESLTTIDNRLTDLTETESSASTANQASEIISKSPTLDGLTVVGPASLATDLHVGGNTLIEGILTVIDRITTSNLVVGNLADFLGNAIFRGNVLFTSAPKFNSDTAGTATIQKDAQSVTVTFTKEYESIPVITTSIAHEGENSSIDDVILAGDIQYIITKKSPSGFTIKINKPAPENIQFSWIALAVAGTQSTHTSATPSENLQQNSPLSPTPSSQPSTTTPFPTPTTTEIPTPSPTP